MSAEEKSSVIKVEKPPSDGVSSVRFSEVSDTLAVSSWDRTLSIYSVNASEMKSNLLTRIKMKESILDCWWEPSSDQQVWSACCDGSVMLSDVNKSEESTEVGRHSDGVRCVRAVSQAGLIATASWDRTLRFWDHRTHSSSAVHSSVTLPSKCFAMGVSLYRVIVGCADRSLHIYDCRRMQIAEQRESPLKHQTRYVEGHPNGKQFAVASIEGRVSVEWFDSSEQDCRFAFKCHRTTDPSTGQTTVYPVNCVSFEPFQHTFATAGCDGTLCIWDADSKKRLSQFGPMKTSISCVDFSKISHSDHSTLLAFAQSYTFERGPLLSSANEHSDQIFVRCLKPSQYQPRKLTQSHRH